MSKLNITLQQLEMVNRMVKEDSVCMKCDGETSLEIDETGIKLICQCPKKISYTWGSLAEECKKINIEKAKIEKAIGGICVLVRKCLVCGENRIVVIEEIFKTRRVCLECKKCNKKEYFSIGDLMSKVSYEDSEEGEHGFVDEELDTDEANQMLEDRNNKLHEEGKRIRPHMTELPVKVNEEGGRVVGDNPELKELAQKQKEAVGV